MSNPIESSLNLRPMHPSIFTYLTTQRIGVLAVEMLDGSPHAATVHFAHTDDPFLFYFETNRTYRKAEPLLANGNTRASFVVGQSEEDLKTLQLDGELRLVRDDEREAFDAIYLAKFENKHAKAGDPNFLPLVFTPTWWRWTDWTGPEGKVILYSEGG